ncbi:MAG: sigma 54-interacting transcriptional regulator [Thermoanaerobaculum sp.]
MTPLFPSKSPQAARLARELARFAPTALPLLLEGETGTGKSFLARRLHRRSRPGRPFLVLDCAAIPATLLPSELFGHTAGAFTDATRRRRGFLELAAEGTLVLDRADALPPAAQASLLRVLEERRFTPLGATQPRPFRARVVALVGPDLKAKIESGQFRPDLYHRLAGYHARLLPLRERPEDILPAARRWLAQRAPGSQLSPEAEKLLAAYPWPGNFRELEAVLQRAALEAGVGNIEAANLRFPLWDWAGTLPQVARQGLTLDEAAKLYALFVLAQEKGNVSRAARVLGVSRRTLIRWRREG